MAESLSGRFIARVVGETRDRDIRTEIGTDDARKFAIRDLMGHRLEPADLANLEAHGFLTLGDFEKVTFDALLEIASKSIDPGRARHFVLKLIRSWLRSYGMRLLNDGWTCVGCWKQYENKTRFKKIEGFCQKCIFKALEHEKLKSKFLVLMEEAMSLGIVKPAPEQKKPVIPPPKKA